jgi:2-polyprenyl-6-hydroxyphenyl methylase/3-demethylubiquinone-9 3-methyltransferase
MIKGPQVFQALGHAWWDPNGPFRLLSAMNPLRIEYILHHIKIYRSEKPNSVLDVGCGGGLLSFPLHMALRPSRTLGIDQCEPGIVCAKNRLQEFPYNTLVEGKRGMLEFKNMSVQELVKSNPPPFDVIAVMEMLEHIESTSDQELLVKQLLELLAPKGMLFLSTINRSWLAKLLTITIAEGFDMVPKGTHDPEYYIKPSQIAQWVRDLRVDGKRFICRSTQGILYEPLAQRWIKIPWDGIHYMMAIQRE